MNISDFPAPHIPKKLPIAEIVKTILSDYAFLKVNFEAAARLSEFIGYLQNLPNPDILVSALTLQESVLSSRIEGTLATISDVVRDNPETETMKNDIVEIINYYKAMLYGQQDLVDRDYHFSKNFVCNLHAILMKNNVRGAHKAPGRFKIEQNYIRNDELGNFTTLPAFLTDEYIENLIEYMNDHREPSPLLQAAVIHSQFEMIHPFEDGNGRVGRLIIPLYLYSTKTIPLPTFFISWYFAANDLEYKKNLFNLSKTASEDKMKLVHYWKEWAVFFLQGVIEESQNHIAMSKRIISLYDEIKKTLRRTDQYEIVDYLFNNLNLIPTEFLKQTNLPKSAVYTTLRQLETVGYIVRTGSERKSRFVFQKLLDVI